MSDILKIGKYEFTNRLIIGSGKYPDFKTTRDATIASGAEILTVPVKRINITDSSKENLMDYFKDTDITILPNSAGCTTSEEVIALFRSIKKAAGIDFIKLEIVGDITKTLYPDVVETLKACEVLAKEDFTVMAYTNDDPIMAKRLENAGASAVMPLAAPIGSGLGIQNRYNVVFVKEAVNIPVIVDAGIGTASDAAVAMELGADGVLTNTAVAKANNRVAMAEAMKYAVMAGRMAYKAGRIPKKPYASASSQGLL